MASVVLRGLEDGVTDCLQVSSLSSQWISNCALNMKTHWVYQNWGRPPNPWKNVEMTTIDCCEENEKKEDCWKLQTTGLEQIAESLKPSHTNQASPAQSNPILACPHPTQSKPIQSEPRLSLQPTWIFSPQWSCACTQFRSRSSEIWWLTTNCTAERVPVSSSVMAVWGLWDSTKVKPILGLGNEYNCERIFYMWRKKIHSWMLPISVISANSNNYTLCISWSFDFIYHLQINVQIAEKKLDKC